MDMDLWWCPVCERAITEQEDLTQRPNLLKRATLPPAQPRYTSKGGVYGPKGSLYCSEACREVEELNGRFAFEQLAACLPDLADRQSFQEERESESTLSSTDDTTDRSRSLSLGRSSTHQPGFDSPQRALSSSVVAPGTISNNTHHQGLTSLSAQRPEINETDAPQLAPPNRRVPILYSSNGTPLIQPSFPQRPGLGSHQRRHHSHYSPLRLWSSRATPAIRSNSSYLQKSRNHPTENACNSVPTYAPKSDALQRSSTNNTRTQLILNHRTTERNDMEFQPEARLEKPAYLWQHYGLFYRSRSGSKRGDWNDPTETTDNNHPTHHKISSTTLSRQGSQKSCQTHPKSNAGARKTLHPRVVLDENHKRITPIRASSMKTSSIVARESNGRPRSTKDRKALILEESHKYCRSWSWDHLPADVPQYPAMDLEQIRLSKIFRDRLIRPAAQKQDQDGRSGAGLIVRETTFEIESSLDGGGATSGGKLMGLLTENNQKLKTAPSTSITAITSSILKCPIQTKKKLFVFQQ